MEIDVSDTGPVWRRREVTRMIGDPDDADPRATALQDGGRTGDGLVVARADPGDSGIGEMSKGVAQGIDAEVKRMVVGERDAIHAQPLQHLSRNRRGSKEERFSRVGPGTSSIRNRALEIEQEEVRLTNDGHDLLGEKRAGR